MPPILLLTRPLPQSNRFAAEAFESCPPHEVVIAPLSEVVGVPFDARVFDRARGLVLTSANAVPFLPKLPPMPAWCVGPATAQAAKAAGFEPRDGGGEAGALIETLTRDAPEGPLVHAHGVHLARDLVAALPQLDLQGVAVYEAQGCEFPPGLAEQLAGRRVVVALFSPRAAKRFANQSGIDAVSDLTLIAISANCAAALPDTLRAHAVIAEAPDGAAMLRAVKEALSQDAPAG
ncbi:uroporphyrinogen-III synthase [Pararhodobacter zhoushanensis]|uniref:uroporphyrinogen-III synthase n=1 Tax=Pararhodobacter zhoushanensis TaxID=2479545 RepID=UPI0013DF1964|nr:uroporphyrinogen-III synthase [Pararhodobacter zhoushanensis]